jgi:group I intron endonuclease
MVHYVYKITNLMNDMFYIGKHSTEHVDDGYMGSGTLLRRAIAKHGLDNFKKEILQFFDTADQALEYERQLVTRELVERKDTYNLNVGGSGSWHAANSNPELRKQKNAKAARSMNSKTWSDPEFRERKREQTSQLSKKLHAEGRLSAPDWTGRKHKEEAKRKIGEVNSKHQSGSGNSNFGNVWIHSLEEKRSIRVPRDEVEAWLSIGWIKGRKMKFEHS